jgi:hypothetical protein
MDIIYVIIEARGCHGLDRDQLPVQIVPITTKVKVSSNHAHGKVYSIQYYVVLSTPRHEWGSNSQL